MYVTELCLLSESPTFIKVVQFNSNGKEKHIEAKQESEAEDEKNHNRQAV